MDPVSSSPTLGVEFGQLPRTPASNRSKIDRIPNGKENTRSGSLHKRIYDSLRFRSRSLSRASDNGSPSSNPVRRRKSIVDLLNLSSRESQNDGDIQDQAHTLKTETRKNKNNYADLFSDMPKKRRSLGNLLNPTNILETITNRVSQKQAPVHQDSPVSNDGLIHEPLVIFLPGKPEKAPEKPTDHVDNAATNEYQKETGPLCVKLAEGGAIDIDLFESRLARILDSVIAEKSDKSGNSDLHDSYLKILQEECERVEGEDSSGSQHSLRPLLSHPCNQMENVTRSCTSDAAVPSTGDTKEKKRPKTPDSYLRLLIASCGGPTQDDQPHSRAPSLQLSETSPHPSSKNLNEDWNATQPFAESEEVESSSIQATPASSVRSFQYQLREKTPDPYLEKELARQTARDRNPTVKVREVSCCSTLLDLDPEFCHRQEERSERYAGLGLTANSDWKYNRERIAQRIASTVARMTQNYHSSSEDFIDCNQGTESTQHEGQTVFNLRCYGNSFEVDVNEAWDSIIVGRHLMLQGESCGRRESLTSVDLAPLLNLTDETSLLGFDGLSTIPRSNISEAYPLARVSAKDTFFPSAEEILQDSTVLRSPPEPLHPIRSTASMGGPLDLDEEIDFCPGYESFLRRSYGILNPRPPVLLQKELQLQRATPKFEDTQILLSSSEKSRQVSYSKVQVRFPGTVNLLQHTESFPSMGDALSGLYNYKLGDLANFYVYDAANRTIDAHLIDSPVPNPADLKKKGLQLHWITQLSNDTTTDTVGDVSPLAENSHCMRRQRSRCDSAWEEFTSEATNFLDEIYPTSSGLEKRSSSYLSLPVDVTREKAMSATNSVFEDDFFLEDQSGQFSEQASVSGDSSAMRVLRAAVSEEEVVAALDFEEEVRATKTWIELAREMRGCSSREDKSTNSSADEKPSNSSHEDETADEGASDNPWKHGSISMGLSEESEAWQSKKQNASFNQISCSKLSNYDIPYGGVDEDDDFYHSLDSPRNPEACGVSVLDEGCRPSYNYPDGSEGSQDELKKSTLSQNLQGFINSKDSDPLTSSHTLEAPVTPRFKGDNSCCNRCALITEKAMESRDEIRHLSVSPDIVIDHSPGYHFTDVKEYMIEQSGEPDGKSATASEHTVEFLDEAADDTHNGIDSEYSLTDRDAVPTPDGIADTTLPDEDTHNEGVQNDKSRTVDAWKGRALEESHLNSVKHHVLDLAIKLDISAAEDIEQADFQDNMITLADLNIRPVGKDVRHSPPTKKGKSKVGALVNIFQDYGLMPEQSRGPLPMSSISPSFSRQSSRYRGEPSGTSVDSGTVRRISAALSTGSRSVPSPVNRMVTPTPTLDRPHSRISDIDTEASFQFGEILRGTKKHGKSEDENTSIQVAEMYG